MKKYIVYITSTGQITRTGVAPEDMWEKQNATGESVLDGTANDSIHYISGGAVTNKPAMGCTINKTTMLANGTEVATISSVPNPTTARITGPATSGATVTDGTLGITFDLAGTYTISLSSLNKLPQEFTINAT